ncbi:hypothetical protein BOX15_Mlig013333g2, partial [Macrostomum lignano]
PAMPAAGLAAALADLLLPDPGTLSYLSWLYYLYLPAITCLLLPYLVVLFLYFSLLWLQLWKWRHRLAESYQYSIWRGAIHTALGFWATFGRLWHGYEVSGLHRLPSNGPALLIVYHGVFPLDVYFLVARLVLETDRQPFIVADNFLWKVPGFALLLRVMNVTPGTVETCADALRQGRVVIIMPGGLREALFADPFYSIEWSRRTGFARVAISAGAPIYPVFTTNIREGIFCFRPGLGLLRRLYERTRLPLVITLGYFPVKLRTFIDRPLLPGPGEAPTKLARRTQERMRRLIDSKQRLPGSVVCGLLMRLPALERWLSPAPAPPAAHESAAMAGDSMSEDSAAANSPLTGSPAS